MYNILPTHREILERYRQGSFLFLISSKLWVCNLGVPWWERLKTSSHLISGVATVLRNKLCNDLPGRIFPTASPALRYYSQFQLDSGIGLSDGDLGSVGSFIIVCVLNSQYLIENRGSSIEGTSQTPFWSVDW